jgi:hypothetical protein
LWCSPRCSIYIKAATGAATDRFTPVIRQKSAPARIARLTVLEPTHSRRSGTVPEPTGLVNSDPSVTEYIFQQQITSCSSFRSLPLRPPRCEALHLLQDLIGPVSPPYARECHSQSSSSTIHRLDPQSSAKFCRHGEDGQSWLTWSCSKRAYSDLALVHQSFENGTVVSATERHLG